MTGKMYAMVDMDSLILASPLDPIDCLIFKRGFQDAITALHCTSRSAVFSRSTRAMGCDQKVTRGSTVLARP